MKHFTTEQWVDFARDAVGKEQKKAMQSHLEDGCGKCSKALSLWKRVHTAAQRGIDVAPPEGTVRIAKAMFAAKPTVAGVLFDSFLAPLPAGVRSVTSAPRQVLYGSGSHRVDVRLEPQVDSDSVAVIGQVLDSAQPGKELNGLHVRMMAGEKLVAEGHTNRFGEFQFEFPLADQLELRIKLESGSEVRAALVHPDPQTVREAAQALDANRARSKSLRRVDKSTRKKG